MQPRTRRLLVGAGLLYGGTWATNRALRRVEGPSMRPTLADGDLVLVAPAGLVGIRRGDVVVVPDPRAPARRTVKRVAALPGEAVEVAGEELRAGAGQLIVLGDDPAWSTDSRTFGPVAAADVLAVAVVGIRPLRRIGRSAPTPARRRTSARR